MSSRTGNQVWGVFFEGFLFGVFGCFEVFLGVLSVWGG